jgi:hypothetical protein
MAAATLPMRLASAPAVGIGALALAALGLAVVWARLEDRRSRREDCILFGVRRNARPKSRDLGPTTRRWSGQVTANSNALDLEPEVFRMATPQQVAESLKRSADRSRRRKADPFRSAMSMLTFYINRAGRRLSAERRTVLEEAKDELRLAYGRTDTGAATARPRHHSQH